MARSSRARREPRAAWAHLACAQGLPAEQEATLTVREAGWAAFKGAHLPKLVSWQLLIEFRAY